MQATKDGKIAAIQRILDDYGIGQNFKLNLYKHHEFDRTYTIVLDSKVEFDPKLDIIQNLSKQLKKLDHDFKNSKVFKGEIEKSDLKIKQLEKEAARLRVYEVNYNLNFEMAHGSGRA